MNSRQDSTEDMEVVVTEVISSIHRNMRSDMRMADSPMRSDIRMVAEKIRRYHQALRNFVPDLASKNETVTVASETKFAQASGLTEKVEEHGKNKNLNLLKQAYGPNGHFPEEAKRDILQQESPLGNTVLHIAARYGNHMLVKDVAYEAPHLLTAKNSNGDTALHVAAKAGHISALRELLVAHIQNLSKNRNSLPEFLQKLPNEILTENKQGNTFIHEALLNSHKRVIRSLINAEDDLLPRIIAAAALFQPNKENKSMFYLAIEAGNKQVVEAVLAQLDIIKKHLGLRQQLILHVQGRPQVLLPAGKSPLLAAIMKRDPVILDIILKREPEWIHLKDTEGRIPLHYAASIGYPEGVQYLLGKCASCAMESDKHGFFPLHLASGGGYVEVVQELLKPEHCLDPREILDNSGRNVVHVAAESGKLDVVRYILQAVANEEEVEKMINDKDVNGNTPLHLATSSCHPKIVYVLTWDKRVHLNLVNKEGQTALDVCEQSPSFQPSFQQRLTWIALKSADARSSGFPIKVPPQGTESLLKKEASNMDPYKDRIGTLMLVSTLITTVTFAAGFTMPGGTNSSDPGLGRALMLNRLWFHLFIFCITISMYGAISVTIILIWAQLGDLTLANLALKAATPLLGVTLATLSLAFLAGVHLVISDLSWLASTSMALGFIFILMLLLLYVLLWFPSTSRLTAVRYISYYPFLLLASLVEPKETAGT